jgi:RNA polymerase sigma-70 factor (ECF subfamily)
VNASNNWIGSILTAARPQAVAALLRYFRDLDMAEEAFQEASLRALKTWPKNGPPRDAAAWLIMVGRNAGVDAVRRQKRNEPLPPEEMLSDLSDAEAPALERIDGSDYRDDILRLLFVCCQPELPATQQIALALRIVSGLTVQQIARAFLVSDAAMEQRITRAKRRVAAAGVPFEAPGPAERAERIAAVAGVIYLVFNEGYTTGVAEHGARAALCEEAIRLARLLLRLFPAEPEIMGLAALMLLQHARADARFDDDGGVILLEDQDRSLWNRKQIAEGLALVDKAMRHRQPGSYQIQAAIAALHARALRFEDTDWAQIDLLYAALEHLQPSRVVTLNRAVAVFKSRGAEEALALIAPLAEKLDGYFYFHGARGAFLLDLGRRDQARVAFDRAIALANTPAEAAYIRQQIDRLAETPGRDAKTAKAH